MEKTDRIFVAGHRGLVGSAIRRELERNGHSNLLLKTHAELDLMDRSSVERFFAREQPRYVFLAAAKVGGILANNDFPADFIRDNLEIQTNVIDAAWRAGVERLLFLGSSCIYPKLCPQPIKEEYLLTGPLEATNRPYSIAKIAGIEMCWSYNRQHGTRFLALMPCNLYGPGDNFDLGSSHVIPALIRKACEAQFRKDAEMEVWGTGLPLRELLYIDDFAEACVFTMNLADSDLNLLLNEERPPLLKVGSGQEISIDRLAALIAEEVGFEGSIRFDRARPDGTPRKILDSSVIRALGWMPKTILWDGIRETIHAARAQIESNLLIQCGRTPASR